MIAISHRAAGLCSEDWHTITVVDQPRRTAMLEAAMAAIRRLADEGMNGQPQETAVPIRCRYTPENRHAIRPQISKKGRPAPRKHQWGEHWRDHSLR